MSTAATRVRRLQLGPLSAGMLLTEKEFDRARCEGGWRSELISGVLVVSPIAARSERHPNDEVGHVLMTYQESHPLGSSLDLTLYEETLECRRNRRRADRVICMGLGRLPQQGEPPSIISTPLLPGFELPLARLLKLADQWGTKRLQVSE
jgi:hypothetical protein